jgi:hypothetical protein
MVENGVSHVMGKQNSPFFIIDSSCVMYVVVLFVVKTVNRFFFPFLSDCIVLSVDRYFGDQRMISVISPFSSLRYFVYDDIRPVLFLLRLDRFWSV